MNGSKEVVSLIGSAPDAIGYSGMVYATPGVKTLRVARRLGETAYPPTAANTISGAYPISRPLYVYTLDEPSPRGSRPSSVDPVGRPANGGGEVRLRTCDAAGSTEGPVKKIRWELVQDVVLENLIRLCGISAVLFIFGIFLFVFREGSGLFGDSKFSLYYFLVGPEWNPTSTEGARYGKRPLLAGTLAVTLLAMGVAVPVGLGGAIFISEFCSPFWQETLKVLIEFLAAIPSVVCGFIGLMVMSPLIVSITGAPIGLSLLNGGIILALMSVPIIASIGEDALKVVPDAYREAALAAGATRWQLIYRLLLPAACSGLLAAVLLGVGRAVGETMALLMATGHSVRFPVNVLDSVRTLTATIAAEIGEPATGSPHYQVLFLIGSQLFLITFAVNPAADLSVRGMQGRSA